jgi:phosphoglycerate dehydrogenase-like enzyme
MANAKVLFLHGLPEPVVEVITSHAPEGFTTLVVDGKAPEAEQLAAAADADFIVVFRAKLTDRLLRAATRVRLVQLLSAGYDRMNLELMRELDIPCANNGGANSWAVAEHTLLLILSLYKRLLAADRSTRAGRWAAPITGMNTYELAGKVVGILGFGHIGRLVARRVASFDAKVQYFDKYPPAAEEEQRLGVARVSLEELFRTSDIVTCHAPLTAETCHIVNRERLALMKPTALVINTSRGPVVDEPALIEALRAGRIAGAGLDVFEKEPVDPDNPLLKMENVVVTPHSAGTTWDTWYRRAAFAYANMKRVWDGERPLAIARDFDIEG